MAYTPKSKAESILPPFTDRVAEAIDRNFNQNAQDASGLAKDIGVLLHPTLNLPNIPLQTANPLSLKAGDPPVLYVKGGKLVVAYVVNGAPAYLTLTLDGSTTTISNSTTAP